MSKQKFIEDLKSAKISIRISLFLFISLLVLVFLPHEIRISILLNPETVFSFSGIYQLFTYWLLQSSIIDLLLLSLAIIMAGIIIENGLLKKDVLTLMAVSILIGGIIFALLEQNEVLFIGASTLSWGVSGAAIIIVFRTWREAPTIAKIITCIFSLGFVFLTIQLIVESSISLNMAHISCGVIGALYGFNKMKKESFWIKETETSIKSEEVA